MERSVAEQTLSWLPSCHSKLCWNASARMRMRMRVGCTFAHRREVVQSRLKGKGLRGDWGGGGPALSHKWKLNKILAKSSLQILWANFNEVVESSQNVDECRHATDKLINYAKEVKIMPTSGMILKDMWDSSRQGNVMTEFPNYKCQARVLSSHANCCPVRTLSSPTNCIIVHIHLGSQLF